MAVEFEPFDISEHLDSEEMIASYLSAAAEDEDPNVLLGALLHAAKARGMMQVAKTAGLNRENLYKALKPGAHPRFETVQAVLRALGVKLAMSARAGKAREASDDGLEKNAAPPPGPPLTAAEIAQSLDRTHAQTRVRGLRGQHHLRRRQP